MQKVKFLADYQGVKVPEGYFFRPGDEYDADDGHAAGLVEMGVAEYVLEPAPAPKQAPKPKPAPAPETKPKPRRRRAVKK